MGERTVPASASDTLAVPLSTGPAGTWGPLEGVELREVSPWDGTGGRPDWWAPKRSDSGEVIPGTEHTADAPFVAVRDLRWHHDRTIEVTWWEETFADHLARRRHAAAVTGPAPRPDASSSIGIVVHVHLRCPQGWLMTKRPAFLSGAAGWYPAASAPLEVGEARSGAGLDAIALRALREELRIDVTDVRPWLWQHLWVDGWIVNLYMVAHTGVTAHELAEGRPDAGAWVSGGSGLWSSPTAAAGGVTVTGIDTGDTDVAWGRGILVPSDPPR
jgi:hypothetical protein